MKVTIKAICSLLSESFPQIELKRSKFGFYLSGGRASQISHQATFWQTLTEVKLETIKSEASALSYSLGELKENLTKVNVSIEEERKNIELDLGLSNPLDVSVYNSCLKEIQSINSHISHLE